MSNFDWGIPERPPADVRPTGCEQPAEAEPTHDTTKTVEPTKVVDQKVTKTEIELKNVVNGLFSSIVAEQRTRAVDLLGTARAEFDAGDRYGALGFNREVMRWYSAALDVVIDDQIARKDKPVDKAMAVELKFIYKNLNIVEAHVRQLVNLRNKRGCSGDWTRTILDAYLNFVIDGKLANFNEDKYYNPKFGTATEWLNFCLSIRPLVNGSPEKYMAAYDQLVTADVRTFPHMCHNWYARLTNNEKLLIDTTWDDHDRQTNYGVIYNGVHHFPADVAQEHGYPLTGDDILGMCTCDVPAADVVRIYKVSKEVEI